MAVVEKKSQGVVANQEAGIAFSEQDRIEVKQIGKEVRIQNNIYSRTNHYIKQSHDYVPEDKERKLTCYIHLAGFQWVFLVAFILGLISPAHYIFAFIMLAISIPFILVFCQHMKVALVTVPILLSLPHLPDNVMSSANDFFEVTLAKYQAVFAATPDTAVGVAIQSKGTIKIHVLSTRARNNVRSTRLTSIVALCAAVFMFCYCGALGGYRLWQLQFFEED